MRHGPAIFALMGSCLATAPTSEPIDPSSVRTVYASSEMSPECTGSVVSAVEKLRTRTQDIELVLVPLTHRVFWLEPLDGEVSVRSDFDEHTHEAPAVVYSWMASDGRVERAEIVLQVCSPVLALRELALALQQVPSEARRDPVERPLGDPH